MSTEDKLNALVDEFEAWNESQRLNLGSADEHHDDPNLTEEQRAWLKDFSRRWKEAGGVK